MNRQRGLVPIESRNIDWLAVRAEYIGGGISQRKLAAKHGIPVDILLKRANREHWKDDREKASNRAATRALQKTADKAADNAVLAADIKRALLLRLQRIEAKYPFDATEIKTHEGKNTVTFRIRDLTGAYRDLAGDVTAAQTDVNAPVFELLRRLDGECNV